MIDLYFFMDSRLPKVSPSLRNLAASSISAFKSASGLAIAAKMS
jgi:hypothetical protein